MQIISQHAKGLFTPLKLLHEIMYNLRFKNSFIWYDLKQLRSFYNTQKWDQIIENKEISSDYRMYVLYCTVEQIKNLNWEAANQIYQDYSKTPKCPAKRYYNNKCSIIILNKDVVGMNTPEFEIQLDHQINHLFEQLNDKEQVEDINQQLQQDIKKYFQENNILSEEELDTQDFSLHMFNKSEFYQMISNLCNVISFYFNYNDIMEVLKKLQSMLKDQYFKTQEFQQLEEPIRGSIIFAFICKKYDLKRWKIVCSMIKKQLDLDRENEANDL